MVASKIISNEQYISNVNQLEARVVLPHEARAIGLADSDSQDRVSGASGVPLLISNEVVDSYRNSLIVNYPIEGEDEVVSLGSTVLVEASGFVYPVGIVGVSSIYTDGVIGIDYKSNELEVDDEEVMAISPSAPLAKAILGKKVGYETDIALGGQETKLVVVSLSQVAIKQYFDI